jgi:hypothetical protein
MDKRLTEGIRQATEEFNELVAELTPEAFEASHLGKWTAGQDLAHLIRSMRLTNFVYTLPLFGLSMLFGRPNRKSRTETDLRDRYRKAIGKGVRAPRLLKPGKISHAEKEQLLRKHSVATDKLCRRLEQMGDDILENSLVKHPAIGKVNLREMAILTRLHTEHHTRLLRAKLSGTAAEEL